MVDQLHEHKLSVCALGVCDVLEGPAEFLDGYILTYDSVIRSTEKQKKMTHKKMMEISDSNRNYILTYDHVVRSYTVKQRKHQVREVMDIISHTRTNRMIQYRLNTE